MKSFRSIFSRLLLLVCTALLVVQILPASPALASSTTTLPYIYLDRPFVDTTHSVDTSFIRQVEQKAQEITDKGYQFGGFIYEESTQDRWEVAADFGNKNGIGFGSKDNGIALVIALQEKGKNGLKPAQYMAVGKGIEGLLPDTKVTRIFEQVYTPTLKETGDWNQATLDVLDAVIGELDGENAYADPFELWYEGLSPTGKFIFWVVVIILLILFLIAAANSEGGGGSYSSGGSSGGGSFGGGSFGGGGGGS